MIKRLFLILVILPFQLIHAQVRLTHNVGDDLIDSGMSSCEEDENWGRIFNLSQFGVTTNEQFIVRSIEVAVSKSYNGANVQYGVYSVDSNFPDSEPVQLGYGGYMLLPQIDSPQIIQFDLDEPIIVPAGVERIMIVIGKTPDSYNPNSAEVILAGTEEDTGGDSWYKGCRTYYSYTSTNDIEIPVPDANLYINATGETFSTSNSGVLTTLSHSVCDNLTKPHSIGCSYGGMSWSREYILHDFGITDEEEFVINSGQVGLHSVGWGVTVQFRIYKIDDNFPESFSETDFIGSSQVEPVSYFGTNTSSTPKIFHLEFDQPVIIPNGVQKILVEVYQAGDQAFPASTQQDSGISWFRSYAGGCRPFEEFVDIKDLGWPDLKLYINVTGQVNNVFGSFGMNITNNCADFLKEFSLTNATEISSVNWNFGDPVSGGDNTSTDLSPLHDFSEDGTYTITASVTGKDGSLEVITETIDVKEPPKAYGISNIEACESSFGTGISTTFDTSTIGSQVLGTQVDKVVTFIDGSGNKYDVLPNPFTNTIRDKETITVRVARKEELCCYAETTFDLIINPLPDLSSIEDIFVCDPNNDGFATFNLAPIQSALSSSGITVAFYFQDGQQIPNSQLDEVTNNIEEEETITLRATNRETDCYFETAFKIAVSLPPTFSYLADLTGCDDNNDGISEYFDTSGIQAEVLGGQTGMEVSYYTEAGEQLSGPLPNPYTNTTAHQETITVRVTNPKSGCYSETLLNLRTSSQPQIDQPATLYACVSGNGIASFDTSEIENQLIGNQTGLIISYYDENGDPLPSPLPSNFQNTKPWEQTISIRVESEANSLCYSETTVDLFVSELPEMNMEAAYFLCDLEPSLYVAANSKFDTWLWTFEDGSVISNSIGANLVDAGTYTLQVTETKNGISCENSFSFNLVRSVLPVIEEVRIKDISSNNQIEIITSREGEFEYSIDGCNFQQQNNFYNLSGGVYNVQVRDKNGCGTDEREVVLVDYPKILTPNNDGYHDRWHIQGISKFPNSKILIYDRYGKLLKELSSNSMGWDGSFNGGQMPSDDYWFVVNLSDGRIFKGHFSLIRS